ncbi:MAG: hypothetical protein FWE92_05730 [Defluviitaleaceae bacterium]|nr:hypothetical protein [Defluviitaleaceae bacterium]
MIIKTLNELTAYRAETLKALVEQGGYSVDNLPTEFKAQIKTADEKYKQVAAFIKTGGSIRIDMSDEIERLTNVAKAYSQITI